MPPMRLTLRTLLAYLDDTLEPEQARQLGQEVANNDEAKAIVERIKKLTRKRSLSTPPLSGGDGPADDPNAVAEYIDNELDTELLREIEEIATDPDSHPTSDVVLAELAACHQILTLVLGEPARVPPSAKQRMYRLVKGRESIPNRKPTATPAITSIDPDVQQDVYDSDEAYLMALPLYRRSSSWKRRLAPVAALALLVCGLALSIRMVLPREPASGPIAFEVASLPTKKVEVAPTPVVKVDPPAPKLEPLPMPKVDPTPDPMPKVDLPKLPLVPPLDKPDPKRQVVGTFTSEDTVLLGRDKLDASWKRIFLNGDVPSTVELVSLPGYHSDIQLHSNVKLTLWGNLPAFLPIRLMESKVKLHTPPAGLDADFTLESGRVFIGTKRADKPTVVRVRYRTEIWDITLPNNQTEILIDATSFYALGVSFAKEPGGESPTTQLTAVVLSGTADFRCGEQELLAKPAFTELLWNNKGDGKVKANQFPSAEAIWSKLPFAESPEAKAQVREFEAALADFSRRLSKKDANVEVMLAEAAGVDEEKPSRRMLAIFCLQALDSWPNLADALNSSTFPESRFAAVSALMHWSGGAPDRDLKFYQFLIDKKSHTDADATMVMKLLHSFSREEFLDPATYQMLIAALNHEKMGVRELAWMWLGQFDAVGAADPKLAFRADFPEDMRTAVIAAWKKRIPDGKLPPRPKQ